MSIIKEIIKSFFRSLAGGEWLGSTRSYSQFGEDAVLQALFRGKKGTYIDVGAYHPILYSNTYALYRAGWQGIAVEPNLRMQPLFAFFRSRDTFVGAALGPTPSTCTYYEYADGAYNTLDASQVARAREKNKVSPIRTREVPVKTLDTIVQESGFSSFDVLCIDIEGMDYDVLAAYSFRVRPTVIVVEDHESDLATITESRVYSLLHGQGYRLIGKAGLSLIFHV